MRKAKEPSKGERGFQNHNGLTKIYEQWHGTMKRARANNSVKWDHGWWPVADPEQAFGGAVK